MKAMDAVLEKTSKNPNVSAFIVDYLMRGFENLGLDNLMTHISDYYTVPDDCVDDQNTLQRRLAFQEMKIGTMVPDFSFKNSCGKQVPYPISPMTINSSSSGPRGARVVRNYYHS